jgi:hypothetical protein
MAMPARKPFELPTTVTIVFRPDPNKTITAHALDFDLVCTSNSREDVIKKIRLAVRSYIEFGFLNGWAEDIRYPAPEKFWPPEGTKLEVMEPIEIMSRELLVYGDSSPSLVQDEHREAASVAQ